MPSYEQPLSTVCRFIERPWGGSRLHSMMGKTAAHSSVIGESWEISDLPGCKTKIAYDHYQVPVGDFFKCYPETLGSIVFDEREQFPILLKYIDARETLSVQLHPTKESLCNQNDEAAPKNEAWYIIKADPGAAIYLGLNNVTDSAQLSDLIANHQLVHHLNRIEVQAGDLYYVPAGTVHAIGAGILLAEVQQCSDTTYRLYDWERLGLDGNPRQLHIKESLQCCSFKPTDTTSHKYLHTDDFHIEVLTGAKLALPSNDLFMTMVVDGQLSVRNPLDNKQWDYSLGSTVILPASDISWQLDATNGSALVIASGKVTKIK